MVRFAGISGTFWGYFWYVFEGFWYVSQGHSRQIGGSQTNKSGRSNPFQVVPKRGWRPDRLLHCLADRRLGDILWFIRTFRAARGDATLGDVAGQTWLAHTSGA